MDLKPAVEELEQAEDVGFYFKNMGGVAFAKPSTALAAPGATAMVAVSSKHGVVFFSDLSGVYALQTKTLVPNLSTDVSAQDYVPPHPADVCLWHQPIRGITQLVLSADEAVLAAVDGVAGTVSFFPLADMRLSDMAAARWSLQLSGVKQFSWCKAAVQQGSSGVGPGLFLVLTADQALRIGRYGDEGSLVLVASSGVEGVDWCPAAEGRSEGSPAFAYSTGRQLTLAAAVVGSAGLGIRALAGVSLEHPQEPGVVYESVRWVLPSALLLGGTEVKDDGADGEESSDEYSSLLMLRSWAPVAGAPPQGATLYTDIPGIVEEDSAPPLSGPYLHAVAIPRWGALVRCHRKAVDDHVRLMRTAEGEFGAGAGNSPQAVAVTEEQVAIRLPNGPDGGSNYVLGLGFDTTVPLHPLPHPFNTEKPPLVPPPVLFVVTSDGALRLYGFGHLDLTAPLRPGTDEVVPLPTHPPAWAVVAGAGLVEKAVPSGLTADELRHEAAAPGVESDSESGEEVTSPGIVGSLAAKPATKQAAFPAVPSGAQAPAASGLRAASKADAIGSSVGAFPAGVVSQVAESGARKACAAGFGFGFGGPLTASLAASPTAAPAGGLFSFASPGSSAGGGLSAAAPASAASGGTFGSAAPVFGGSAAATAAPSVPVPPRKEAPAPAAPAVKLPAVDVLRPTAKAPAAVLPPPRPASHDVPTPKPKLADESKEAASAEASFLRELHEVRRMVAKLDAIMKDIVAGCPGACGGSNSTAATTNSAGGAATTTSGYKAVGVTVEALACRAAAMRAQYERANKRVAGLFDGLGSLQSMLDALQLFSGGGGAPATLAALEANLPLEPALDALRRDVATRLEALGTCLGELEDVLDSWADPQGVNPGKSVRLSSSVLYGTLASAGSALSAAANRVLVLAAKLEELGACQRGLVKDPSGPLAGLVAWCTNGSTSSGSGPRVTFTPPAAEAASPAATPIRTPDGKTAARSTASDTQWHTPLSADGRRSPLLEAGAITPRAQQQRASPVGPAAINAFLPRLQALARIGGRVRVTSAVRPPAPTKTPGAALLELVSAAEAARDALPEAPVPTSRQRAQVQPTQTVSSAASAAAPKATVATQPGTGGFNFGAVAVVPGKAPPTPSLTAKLTAAAAAPGVQLSAAAPAAQTVVPAAATKPKAAAQPPMPTMAQLQAASKVQAEAVGAASVSGAAAAATAKPAATLSKPSGSGQPPVPSMALFAQAAQLQQKALGQQAASAARPTDSGSSAGSTATSKPPAVKPQVAASPPVPSMESMRAAAAAQARLQQQSLQQQQQSLQQQQQHAVVKGAPAQVSLFGSATTTGIGQPATGGGPGGGFGFGFGLPAASATSVPASASAAAVPAPKPATAEGGAAGPAGLSFGFGALSFGTTAPSTTAANASTNVAAGSSNTMPFNLEPSTTAGGSSAEQAGPGGLFSSLTAAGPAAPGAVAPAAAATGASAQSQSAAAAAPFGAALGSGTANSSGTAGVGSAANLFGALNFGAAPASATAVASGGSNAVSQALPFGSLGQQGIVSNSSAPAATASTPAGGTSLFGAFASSAAASSAALGASGFGVFSSQASSAPAAGGGAAPSPGLSAGASPLFSGASAAPALGAFSAQGGIQSKAAMPTVQAGVFSSFGQAPAFGSPAAAAAGAPAFGSPATLGGGAAPVFGVAGASPAAPAPPALGGTTFGSSGFGAPAAFGSPAPVAPAVPTAPVGGAFGHSSSLGNSAAGNSALSGFSMQAATGAGSAAPSGPGFGTGFASSAPSPPAPASGGFAAFASGGGGGFGGFVSVAQQQGGAFSSSGGNTYGSFGGLGGGLGAAPSGGSSAAADLWKPRK